MSRSRGHAAFTAGVSRRLWLILLAGYVAFLIVLGWSRHGIHSLGPECDDFVAMAEQILAGRVPRDRFRPALFPALTAALGWLLGDCFAAARVVSAVSAGLLVAATRSLGRSCFGPEVGAVAALLVACNGDVVVMGCNATTDMLFAALSCVTLAMALDLRSRDRPGAGRHLALGLMWAAAWSTRYQGLILAVPLGLSVLTARGPGALPCRARLGRLGILAGAFGVGVVPQALVSVAAFGRPFHDENWRTVAIRHFGQLDYSRLDEMPFDGMASVLLHDPWAILAAAGRAAAEFAGGGFAAVLEGVTPADPAGWFLVSLFLLGLVCWVRGPRGSFWIVALYAVCYVGTVLVTFVPAPRIVLPVLPVGVIPIALAVVRLTTAPAVVRRARRPVVSVGAIVCAAVLVGPAVRTFEQFLARHPWAELRAVRELQDEHVYPVVVLSTYPYIARYTEGDVRHARRPYERDGVVPYLTELGRRARGAGAEYVVLGRVSTGAAVFDELLRRCGDQGGCAPFECVRFDSDVLVLRLGDVQLQVIDGVHVAADAMHPGRWSIEVRLRGYVDPARIRSVSAVFVGSDERIVVPLSHDGGVRYVGELDSPRTVTGSWRVVPIASSHAGRHGAGPPAEVAHPRSRGARRSRVRPAARLPGRPKISLLRARPPG
ncbi:MAG: glycosyltransferase family 39 protein [Planctomycetes bacterium]|nr:glycosyltransferase family 39 protein [Planctomycetota bacterium]